MSAADQKQRSQKTAEDLKKRGIYHGKRTTTPRHANYPKLTEVGSAAYRRMRASMRDV